MFDFDFDVNAVAENSSENNNSMMTSDNDLFHLQRNNRPSYQNSESMERLPDPPINKVKLDFDYGRDIPKPQSIIPRVKVDNKTR